MIPKTELAELLAKGDHDALVGHAREAKGRVLRFVTGRLCSADEGEKRRAVAALGALVRADGLLSHDAVLDLLRRFHWALNDESGAVPYGIPEAMGEVVAARPEFGDAFIPVLCGMLTEEEALQTGPVERGVIWALGRLGPEVAGRCPEAAGRLAEAAEDHPDRDTRDAAARALEAVRG